MSEENTEIDEAQNCDCANNEETESDFPTLEIRPAGPGPSVSISQCPHANRTVSGLPTTKIRLKGIPTIGKSDGTMQQTTKITIFGAGRRPDPVSSYSGTIRNTDGPCSFSQRQNVEFEQTPDARGIECPRNRVYYGETQRQQTPQRICPHHHNPHADLLHNPDAHPQRVLVADGPTDGTVTYSQAVEKTVIDPVDLMNKKVHLERHVTRSLQGTVINETLMGACLAQQRQQQLQTERQQSPCLRLQAAGSRSPEANPISRQPSPASRQPSPTCRQPSPRAQEPCSAPCARFQETQLPEPEPSSRLQETSSRPSPRLQEPCSSYKEQSLNVQYPCQPQSRVQPPQSRLQPPQSRLQPPQSRLQQPQSRIQPPQPTQPQSRLQPPQSRLQPPQPTQQALQSRLQPPQSRLQPPQSRLQPPQPTQQAPQSRLQPPQSRLQPPQSRIQPPQPTQQAPQSRMQVPSKIQAPSSRLVEPQSRLQEPQSKLRDLYSTIQASKSRLQELGSKLQAPQSRLPASQSRLQPPQSRLQPPQSRLPASQSRLQAPQSKLQAPQSRLQGPCSSLQASRSRLQDPPSGLQASRSKLQGPCSSLQASRSLQESVKRPRTPSPRLQQPCSNLETSRSRLQEPVPRPQAPSPRFQQPCSSLQASRSIQEPQPCMKVPSPRFQQSPSSLETSRSRVQEAPPCMKVPSPRTQPCSGLETSMPTIQEPCMKVPSPRTQPCTSLETTMSTIPSVKVPSPRFQQSPPSLETSRSRVQEAPPCISPRTQPCSSLETSMKVPSPRFQQPCSSLETSRSRVQEDQPCSTSPTLQQPCSRVQPAYSSLPTSRSTLQAPCSRLQPPQSRSQAPQSRMKAPPCRAQEASHVPPCLSPKTQSTGDVPHEKSIKVPTPVLKQTDSSGGDIDLLNTSYIPKCTAEATIDEIKKLIEEEKRDVLQSQTLSPELATKLKLLKKKSLLEETLQETIPTLNADVMEGEDIGSPAADSDVVASLMHSEEQGVINTGSSPKKTYDALFGASGAPEATRGEERSVAVSPAAPSPLNDIVVPVGEASQDDVAVLNPEIEYQVAQTDQEIPKADAYSETLQQQQQQQQQEPPEVCAAKKECCKRKADGTFEGSPVRRGVLEEQKAPWDIDLGSLEDLVGGQLSMLSTGEQLPSDESIRATLQRFEYILDVEKPKHYSCVQLRGTQRPSWFPGYYFVHPENTNISLNHRDNENYVRLEQDPSKVFAQVWNIFKPNNLQGNSEVVIL